MIGNDIVDLQLAAKESNWKRPGLHSKIFTEGERELLKKAKNEEQRFWLFWAMKEAAYKAHQRRFSLPRKFNPKSFRCELDPSEGLGSPGMVKINNWHYFTTAKISEKVIHCVASVENSAVQKRIFSDTINLKQELISAVANSKKLFFIDLGIKTDFNFIPHLILKGKNYNLPFSISHHGNYSAYVFAVN
ncbi:4'-phosphopantetheinyl transferase family protein [Autumnicola psychrophila]|uniref:4'-phosphopantetheinyl transferase superfamily protein n=1 Tax=Autumnicola psychrophila TaxID=3075592 RepID=A0ABU3DQA2_9FLAO|nr:4'-phosphopantetheinyl transferase superfamily protein [Zunongwangia sp. F225]MDT0685709.1 4'-phosphopantetheinyl transferase superfamily protein [Zunongwangia sp. F225]